MSSIPRGDIEADSSISCTREAGTWTVRSGGQDDVLGRDACSSSSLIPLGKEIRVRDEAGIIGMMYLATRPEGGVRTALLPEEDATNEPFGSGTGDEAI
jgi:hypothetical protein